MTFGEKLKKLRLAAGLTQDELALKLGTTKQSISRYENSNREPNIKTAKRIANALGVSLESLAMGEKPSRPVPMPVREIDTIFAQLNTTGRAELCSYGRYLVSDERYRRDPAEEQDAAPARVIPLLGEAFAAGSPETPGDLFMSDYLTEDPRAEFAIRVNGDSMEPWLPDGSIALGVKRVPRDGEVGAFFLDGGFLVKQFCSDSFDNIYLFSLNRARSDADLTLWHDAERDLRLVGTILMSERVPLP